MRLFDKSFSFGLVICGLPLLFLPKINLISLGAGETAGIRVDDILLVFLFLIIGWAHFSLHKRMSAIEKWLFGIVAFSLFSFSLNRTFVAQGGLHVNSNIFYCLRLAEYFVFFYIGAMALSFFRLSAIIKTFLIWNLGFMLLQKAGWVGQFSFSGYVASAEDRVVGIASFPSEAGMLLNLIFCFLIYDEEKNRRLSHLLAPDIRSFFEQTRIYWLFLICSVLVVITGSRIAIVALAIPFLFRLKGQLNRRFLGTWVFAILFVSLGVALTAAMIQNTASVAMRSAGLLSWKNFDLIGMVWERLDVFDPIDNEVVKYEAYDMSWWMRIHKWCYALKIYYLHPECWLQGVGPGFATAALDGGFLRILTEYGLIGSFFFWKLFSHIYRQSVQLRWMIIAFAFNMIFFDVYLAYKPMSLLFFVSGYTWAKAYAGHPVAIRQAIH